MALTQEKAHCRSVDYTISALSDRFTFVLCSKYEVEFIEEEIDDGKKVKNIHLNHPYIDHAEWVLYRINTFSPLPTFVIHESDIPKDVASTFDEVGKVATSNLITDVVRRILESINPEYFLVNGIYGKVKWRIDP